MSHTLRGLCYLPGKKGRLCHQGLEQRGEYSVGSVPWMKISRLVSSADRSQPSLTNSPVFVSMRMPSTKPVGLGKSFTGVSFKASRMNWAQSVAAFQEP